MTATRSSTTSTRPPGDSAAAPREPWLALGAIVLLAIALRFATLGVQSIWFDEAATWDLVRRPFGEMLRQLPHGESTPPLFYVLEWCSARLLGDGEVGLRALSALAGVLTVPVGYGIGRRLGGARAGLATAALLAVNPLLVWFSQEARSYALVALLSAAALLLFLDALEDPRPRRLAAWAAVAALALATHYFAAFVLLPQALWLLRRHPRRRAALAAVGALVAVGAALLPLLLAQRGNPYDIAGDSLAVRAVQVPKQFLLGYHGPAALAFGLLGTLLAAGGAWLLLQRTAQAARDRALGVAAIGVLGVALPLGAALAGVDYLNARNAIPALAPLLAALGVAYGASALRVGRVLLLALCAVSVAIVVAVAVDTQYQRPDWAGLAHALGRTDASRAIVVSPTNGDLPLRYYRRALRPMASPGTITREVDVVDVASASDPGAAPALPVQVGEALGAPGFGPAQRIATDTYVLLRFRALRPVRVAPSPLAAVRFSPEPPAVEVLPAGR